MFIIPLSLIMATVWRTSGFEVYVQTNTDPYPTGTPYIGSPTCPWPTKTAAGDKAYVVVGCTSRSPVVFTSSGFAQTSFAGGNTTSDGFTTGERDCDGTETGVVTVGTTGAPHDWHMMVIVVRSTNGNPLVTAYTSSTYTDLGVVNAGSVVNVTGPTNTPNANAGDLIFSLTSVASLGQSGLLTEMNLPSGFMEISRCTDTVLEFVSAAVKLSTGAATATYSGTCKFDGSDTLRSFGANIVVTNQPVVVPPSLALGAHTTAHSASTSGNTTVTTSGITTVAGGALYAACAFGGAQTVTVADNKGNTWRAAIQASTSRGRLFICENPINVGAGHTVTFTFAGNEPASVFFGQFTGTATSPVDQSGTSLDDTDPLDCSLSGATTQANEVVISFIASGRDAPTYTAPSGYTLIDKQEDGTNYWTGAVAYKIVSATGTYTASWSPGSSGGSAAQMMVSLKGA